MKVLKDNGKVTDGTLAVVGYDVRGSVTSDNQPITGVSFVLFSKTRVCSIIIINLTESFLTI